MFASAPLMGGDRLGRFVCGAATDKEKRSAMEQRVASVVPEVLTPIKELPQSQTVVAEEMLTRLAEDVNEYKEQLIKRHEYEFECFKDEDVNKWCHEHDRYDAGVSDKLEDALHQLSELESTLCDVWEDDMAFVEQAVLRMQHLAHHVTNGHTDDERHHRCRYRLHRWYV